MKYRILTSTNFYETDAQEDLEKTVNMFIRSGWKPLGGVSIARRDDKAGQLIVMTQAMIKE